MAKNIEELNADIKKLDTALNKSAKSLKNFKSQAEDTADEVERVGVSFKDSKERLEGFGASMRAVGGNIGPVEDMATALEKLGPAGFVRKSVVAALVGGVFAVAKFAQVTVEATRAAGGLLDEWDNPHVFAAQTDAITDANDALDGLVFAGQRLQVLFAAGMSPAVVEVARTVAALSLALTDVVDVAGEWGVTLENVTQSQVDASLGLTLLATAVGALNSHYGEQIDNLFELGEALEEANDPLAEQIGLLNELAAAAEAERDFMLLTGEEKTRLYYEEKRRKEKAAADAKKLREQEQKELEASVEAAMNAEAAKVDAQIEERERAAAEEQRLFDEQTASIQAAAEAEAQAVAAAIEVEKRGREELAKSSINLADTLLAAVQDNANTETAEGRRTARQVFGARKALALADVAIATIVAVQQALASAPPPFNAIPAAAMGVAGAANLAAVAAQKPPSFAIGGLVPSDHRLIGAQAGEGILSTAAVRALGEEQVGAMNRGTASGAPVEVAMVYRHRVFDRFVQDNLRRSDSPLAGAIQGARRKRKRRR
jgi:septal ring factor EnvC (AmiA/AmiB activator)